MFERPRRSQDTRDSQFETTTRSTGMPRSVGREAPSKRTISNQQLQRQLREHGFQAKLTVNEPDDEYEREAERIADAVVRMPEPSTAQATPRGNSSPDTIPGLSPRCQKRQQQVKPLDCPNCENEFLRQEGSGGKTSIVDAETRQRIQSLRGSGRPLPESVRSFFEPRFGTDFSGVRVHTGPKADDVARVLGAKAYTVGQDIAFRSSAYRPYQTDGKRLLAHELTHVIQQGGAGPVERIQRQADGESLPLSWDVVDKVPKLSEREKILLRIESLRASVARMETLLEKGRVTEVQMNDLEGILAGLFGPGMVMKGLFGRIESVAEFSEQGGWKSVVGFGGLILSPLVIMPWMALGRAADPWISIYQSASAAVQESGDEYVFSEAEMAELKQSKRKTEAQIRKLHVKLNKVVDEPMRPSSGHIP